MPFSLASPGRFLTEVIQSPIKLHEEALIIAFTYLPLPSVQGKPAFLPILGKPRREGPPSPALPGGA